MNFRNNKIVVPPSQLVILEGNISAGKSSLARDLGDKLGFKVFLEPALSNPYLDSFYKDPKRWALPMQIWLLTQRYYTYVAAVEHVVKHGGGVILDRSLYSDWVFAERNRLDGNIPEEGFNYYMQLRHKMMGPLPAPHTMLYLDVSAKECFNRVHNMRQRSCESTIPIEYLQGLDDVYNRFADDMSAEGTHVIRLDWEAFGDSTQVASRMITEHQQAVPPPKWAAVDELAAFLDDPKQIHSLTKLAPTSGWSVPAECCSLASTSIHDADLENRMERAAAAAVRVAQ